MSRIMQASFFVIVGMYTMSPMYAIDIFKKVKSKVEQTAGQVKKTVTGVVLKGDRTEPFYCPLPVGKSILPTINDPSVQQKDTDNMLELIKKYSPRVWLHSREQALPITAHEYFTGARTRLVSKSKGELKAKGQVTNIDILNNMLPDAYFDIEDCVKFGSNPAFNTDAQGNLTTPIFAYAFEKDGKLYIQYGLFYGFNGPYSLGGIFIDDIIKGDIQDVQNGHEGDMEHMTFEFDKNTRALQRIFYGSHGKHEGYWLPANHPDITYEDGTHPVVYSAKGGHGNYNKAGTYVRIYGQANDLTQQGKKWHPHVIRVYNDKDPRFDKESMGWVYHKGQLGRRGIAPLAGQSWFGKPEVGDLGQPYENVNFCPEGPNQLSCARSKITQAKPPK